MRRPSIEPDDGYEFEKDQTNHKTWEEWEADRNAWLSATYPGLFDEIAAIQCMDYDCEYFGYCVGDDQRGSYCPRFNPMTMGEK